MARFATAIFDLDGTLADTLPIIYGAFNAAPRPILGRPYTVATYRRYLETYDREYERLVTAFHGIDEVLRKAAKAGIELGVVTGKSRQTALFTLEALGLLPVFGAVYAGDDVERQKPDPEAVIKILRDLNHAPGSPGAFIGDSAADIAAGRAAGLTTIAVTWGSPDHTELFASRPDVVVHNAEDLKQALGL